MIMVTGANGVVGKPLVDRLSTIDCSFMAVSRGLINGGITWDLEQPPSAEVIEQLSHCTALIHCAPIWLLSAHLDVLADAGVERIVAFSSTSVISKLHSGSQHEQQLVALLSESERSLTAFCQRTDVSHTILRPSMIYGYGRDENVSRIAGFIRRFGLMFLMGEASGKRQPVHADDLVDAALAVLKNQRCHNKTYTVAGAEVLTYRAMVERIFCGLHCRKRIISLPLWLYRALLKLASAFTTFDYTPDMADRMNQDLVYCYQQATDDFAYQPRAFLSQPENDLP